MNKEKEIWVDCIKGMTIVVVVLLHIPFSWNDFFGTIEISNIVGNAWDMPVFFVVGGFFLSTKRLSNTGNFIGHKFSTLYVKLLCYYIPILLLHNLFLSVGLYNADIEYGGKYMTFLTLQTFLVKLLGVMCFAGREPYASPLWFVYVLFEAFIVLAILYKIILYIFRGDERKTLLTTFLVVLILSIVSLYCSNYLNITVPRISNMFPALWLILLGYVIKQRIKIKFQDWRCAVISSIVLVIVCLSSQHMAMMTNSYAGVLQLTVCGCSALYLLAYLSKRVENNFVGRCLSYIGRHSYEIMAFHLLAINLFAWFLNIALGFDLPIDVLGSHADNWTMLFVLTLAGTFIPVGFFVILNTALSTTRKIWKRY